MDDGEATAPWRCRRCRSTATLENGRVTVRSWQGGYFLCPPCAERRQPVRMLRNLGWAVTAAVGLAVAVPLLTGRLGPAAREPGLWLSVTWFVAVWLTGLAALAFALVAVHELGHAAVARLLGFRVFQIRIGTGPSWQVWVGDVDVKVGVAPFGGLTLAMARRAEGYRWRRAVIGAAGLGTEALVLAAVLGFGLVPDYHDAVIVFVGVNWLANLWPRTVEGPLGPASTDGRTIARAVKAEPSAIEREIVLAPVVSATALIRRARYDLALRELDGLAQERFVAADVDALRATALLGRGDLVTARDMLKELLDDADRDGAERVLDANNLAWCELLLHTDEGLSAALTLSEEAFEALGWEACIQSTRGLALALTGRVDEGLRLLHRALSAVRAPHDRAELLCTIAIAEARRREPVRGRRALDLARTTDPRCSLLGWAEDELGPVEAALAGSGTPLWRDASAA